MCIIHDGMINESEKVYPVWEEVYKGDETRVS